MSEYETSSSEDDGIFHRVERVVDSVLPGEAGRIRLDSSITKDLGGQPIHELDITFLLEREFGVRLQKEFVSGVDEGKMAVATLIETIRRKIGGTHPRTFSLEQRDVP